MFQGGKLGCGSAIVLAIAGLLLISQFAANDAHRGAVDAKAGLKALQDKYGTDGTIPSTDASAASNPWSYSESADAISGGSVKFASNTSINQVQFSAPYDGGSTLDILIRKHPRKGVDALVTVSNGQIVCDISEGCPIHASFDGGKVRTFTGRTPADYGSKTLFIEPSGSFIAALQKSKSAVLEVNFYEQGGEQFMFDTANLHWPPPKGDITPP